MASRNQESAILIINDPSSAVDILQSINKFSRVFLRYPIKILRGDSAADRNNIIALTKQFRIQSVPALITRDNNVLVGCAKICSFLPQLAHAINTTEQRQQQSTALHEVSFRDYQLQESEMMNERGEDGDQPDDAGEIGKRMAEYRMKMEQRNAKILQETMGPQQSCPNGQPSKGAREPMTNRSGPDLIPQQLSRNSGRPSAQARAPLSAIAHAPATSTQMCQARTSTRTSAPAFAPYKSSIAEPGSNTALVIKSSSEDPFDRKFYEMFEKTTSAT